MKAPRNPNGNGEGGGYKTPPPGSYVARFIRIIDLGTQDDTYEGQPVQKRKIFFQWELGTAKMDDGRPYVVGKEYGFSTYKNANLRKMLHDLNGGELTNEVADEFDFRKLLGAGCMVTMGQNKKKDKVIVIGVMKRPKEMPQVPQVNKALALFLAPEEFDREVFDQLSEHWKNKIKLSPEYKELVEGQPQHESAPPPPTDDDIPF